MESDLHFDTRIHRAELMNLDLEYNIDDSIHDIEQRPVSNEISIRQQTLSFAVRNNSQICSIVSPILEKRVKLLIAVIARRRPAIGRQLFRDRRPHGDSKGAPLTLPASNRLRRKSNGKPCAV
jgi:hypothetical protein